MASADWRKARSHLSMLNFYARFSNAAQWQRAAAERERRALRIIASYMAGVTDQRQLIEHKPLGR